MVTPNVSPASSAAQTFAIDLTASELVCAVFVYGLLGAALFVALGGGWWNRADVAPPPPEKDPLKFL